MESNRPQHFRPISPVNSMYKIVSKVLAERFKKMHPQLISEHQGEFIQGKLIQYGILIAGELIEDRLRSKKSGVLCKLDIEKAFNNVKLLFRHAVGGSRIWCEVEELDSVVPIICSVSCSCEWNCN